MSHSFRIPVIVILFCAFVLSIFVSISLPHLKSVDITRVDFTSAGSIPASDNPNGIAHLRFGIWAPCYYLMDGQSECGVVGHGYSVDFISLYGSDSITAAWTRGLAVHPVATGVTFIALVLSLSNQITVSFYAFISILLATLLGLLAFVLDIALEVHVKTVVNSLSLGYTTSTGPGFWLSFVSPVLLIAASCVDILGRRRDRKSGDSSYPLSFTKNWT
ncbi:hypothetical protein SERLA73DRAFT_187735 [Serpula lacrymans var. lacrymans S7.3]|uniref:Pali-domain-containing protein n=2 Tax=Serpula lacrymans var. lacrymans TaxID=341189 RepID=F8QA93_SERL3|nr:uncharacterized protein SERLADRAFT_477506 [Serpula lacrymans var. lacrymans S7.9]EGN94683.1 hypothetical protein SERLA73DRAFT_187735 [Serpula lacrymans var. lacrymans S7.3]EGO20165.1 hypothetical protein SERLADRAFT_477506 [Serpula lacrymans var. lacrymans S7.9]